MLCLEKLLTSCTRILSCVCPDHRFFIVVFCFLCSLFHPFIFFIAVLTATYATSSSVSVCNSETIGDYPPQIPKPQF